MSVLGVDALKNFVAAIYAYLPNVLAAALIFLVASALAAGVGARAGRTMGKTTVGKIVGTVAPILIMTVATFVIRDQVRIAHTIVVITYAAVVGAVALGLALAFGLGGREIAGEMLRGAYVKGQENSEQMKQELQQAKQRPGSHIERSRVKLADESGPDAGSPRQERFSDILRTEGGAEDASAVADDD